MHRRQLLTWGLALGLVWPALPAASQSVSTDAAPGVSFASYRTYEWISTAAPQGANPVMFQRIITDFEAELAKKGYRKAAAADLSLAITIGAQQKTDIESWGRFGLQTSVYQYTQGQLSLDVFDTKTHKALWHGQVSKTVDPNKPNPAAVDKAISKLMKKFPVAATAGAAVGS